MKSLKLLHMLFDDVKRQMPEHKLSLDRDFKTIERRYRNEGFSFLAKTLPSFGDAVFASLELGFFDCPTGFSRKGALPRFLGGLLEVIFDRRTGLLKHDKDTANLLAEIRQITFMFRKALAHQSDERKLDERAKATFTACDWDINDIPDDPTLRSISRALFHPSSEQDLEWLEPRNGPGGVSEGYRSNRKYSGILGSLDTDIASKYGWTFIECQSYFDPVPSDKSERVAILHSVPKNSTSRRTITIEPAVNMFCQQAWNGLLRKRISSDPFLSRSITLDDQKPSQEMALLSSFTRSCATVDLSAASDRLSLDLVKMVFQHDTVLLDGLLLHRTPYVSSGNVTLILRKYAGMGNATTFPIQSIVFAFLSVKAILKSWSKTPSRRNCRRALRLVRVYGDDIILPTYAYSALCQELSDHGLKVNSKKSYYNSGFRESCGLDAYDGVEITPTYVRSDLDTPTDQSHFASLASTSNQLWMRGYYKASDYLRELVEEALGQLPLVLRNSPGIGWYSRTDSFEPHRWNKTLHRWEQKTACISTRKQVDKVDGFPALLKFFCEPMSPQRMLESSVMRFRNRIRKRWMPA